MSETTNYHLPLADDDKARFLDWRNSINGPGDSAMKKIDTVLSEKADHSVSVPGILLSDSWIGDTAPFMQELTVDGLSAEQNGSVGLGAVTPEQMAAACDALLAVVSCEEGKLTIAANGKRPKLDIPVVTILLG